MQITGKFENEHLICTSMERLYLFRNSTQIEAQTGFQGYLRGDFDKGRDKFFSNFFPSLRRRSEKAQFDNDFADALQEVMDELRENGFLKSFSDMRRFCREEADAGRIETQWATQYGVRIDHKGFTFMLRLCPKMGDYHVWVFCYRTDWLTQHMEKARSGIRFIDSSYQEKFRLEDGGKIRITPLSGTPVEHVCRYIDDYHFEVISVLYHICEFTEYRERAGDKVEPVSGKMENPEDKRRKVEAFKRMLFEAPSSTVRLSEEDAAEIMANKDHLFDELLAGKYTVAYVYDSAEDLGKENSDNELRERDDDGNLLDDDYDFGSFLLGVPGAHFYELTSGKIIELERVETEGEG